LKVKDMPAKSSNASLRSLQEEIERGKYRERALELTLIRRIEDLAKAEKRVRDMQSSFSWQLTRPLRSFRSLFRHGARRSSRRNEQD
jgi:hypothetical protein